MEKRHMEKQHMKKQHMKKQRGAFAARHQMKYPISKQNIDFQ